MLAPAPVWPWGCEAHQAIARIAETHMTRHALETANHVLRSAPIDPSLSRFCGGVGLDAMEDASTWADDVRSLRSETGPWHYINIPRGAPRNAVAKSCPSFTGCVTSAILRNIELVRRDSTDAKVRADALRFVIHLVGDLHQPLHCITNDDLGGNCVPVWFFGSEPIVTNPTEEFFRPNLHAIWDSGIVEHLRGSTPDGQWAATLNHQYISQSKVWGSGGMHLDEWAWESHQLADVAAYGRLPRMIPVEKPEPVSGCSDDHHISERMLKLHEQVSQRYVDAVAPVIDEQIVKAGVRLAMILNQLWP